MAGLQQQLNLLGNHKRESTSNQPPSNLEYLPAALPLNEHVQRWLLQNHCQLANSDPDYTLHAPTSDVLSSMYDQETIDANITTSDANDSSRQLALISQADQQLLIEQLTKLGIERSLKVSKEEENDITQQSNSTFNQLIPFTTFESDALQHLPYSSAQSTNQPISKQQDSSWIDESGRLCSRTCVSRSSYQNNVIELAKVYRSIITAYSDIEQAALEYRVTATRSNLDQPANPTEHSLSPQIWQESHSVSSDKPLLPNYSESNPSFFKDTLTKPVAVSGSSNRPISLLTCPNYVRNSAYFSNNTLPSTNVNANLFSVTSTTTNSTAATTTTYTPTNLSSLPYQPSASCKSIQSNAKTLLTYRLSPSLFGPITSGSSPLLPSPGSLSLPTSFTMPVPMATGQRYQQWVSSSLGHETMRPSNLYFTASNKTAKSTSVYNCVGNTMNSQSGRSFTAVAAAENINFASQGAFYSRKVFLGGVPSAVTEEQIACHRLPLETALKRAVGPVNLVWPAPLSSVLTTATASTHETSAVTMASQSSQRLSTSRGSSVGNESSIGRSYAWQSACLTEPKKKRGYCYAIFDSEQSVLQLLQLCRRREKGFYVDLAALYSISDQSAQNVQRLVSAPTPKSTQLLQRPTQQFHPHHLTHHQTHQRGDPIAGYLAGLGPIQVIPWDTRDVEFSVTKTSSFNQSSEVVRDNNVVEPTTASGGLFGRRITKGRAETWTQTNSLTASDSGEGGVSGTKGKRVVGGQRQRQSVFVGALHGMMTARALFTVCNDLFGSVESAILDTDKYKYPVGSGRVNFSSMESYSAAVRTNLVRVESKYFRKTIQIDPYLEDSLCSRCLTSPGVYFCRDPVCFAYFCPACWTNVHSSQRLSPGNAIDFNSKTKDSAVWQQDQPTSHQWEHHCRPMHEHQPLRRTYNAIASRKQLLSGLTVCPATVANYIGDGDRSKDQGQLPRLNDVVTTTTSNASWLGSLNPSLF